jgi:hypothetical protein
LTQGDKNELFPIKHAEQLSTQLTGVKNGPILYSVKGESIHRLLYNIFSIKLHIGGPSMLSVIPGHASIMNKVISNFWSRLPHHTSPISPPKTPIEVRMSEALETLAMLTGRENEDSTKPLCALSFSCLSPDVIKYQSELLEYYKKDCYRAFSPLTILGRPLRKCAITSIQKILRLTPPHRFSERESEHWFTAESHGLSIASGSFHSWRD